MNNKIIIFMLLIFFIPVAHGSKIIFSGRVVENAVEARNTCLNSAIKYGITKTCSSGAGTILTSTIKDKMVTYKGKRAQARLITLSYK